MLDIQQRKFLINRPPSPTRKSRKTRFLTKITIIPTLSMGRTSGAKDLLEAKRGALIELYNTSHIFRNQLAKKYSYYKRTVSNILKRAENAEKENLNLLSS